MSNTTGKDAAGGAFDTTLPVWVRSQQAEGKEVSLDHGLDAEQCLEFLSSQIAAVESNRANLKIFESVLGRIRVHDSDSLEDIVEEFFRRKNVSAASGMHQAAEKGGDSIADEAKRFEGLHKAFMALPENKNRLKRTGWTKQVPGYKPICWGSSARDLFLIIFLFLVGYTVLGFAFWGLLEAYLATDQDFEVLYVFAGMMPVAMCVLACVVAAGNRARTRREAEDVEAME